MNHKMKHRTQQADGGSWTWGCVCGFEHPNYFATEQGTVQAFANHVIEWTLPKGWDATVQVRADDEA
jgi:hypothetical protein